MFLIAYGIYMGIFAIDRYADTTKGQQSYYYASAQQISPYLDSSKTVQQTSCDNVV